MGGGHARYRDMHFKILGTGPLLWQALQNLRDKPALGTCLATCLVHARSWDMPSKHFWDKPDLGTRPFKMRWTGPLLGYVRTYVRTYVGLAQFLGEARSWDMRPCTYVRTYVDA